MVCWGAGGLAVTAGGTSLCVWDTMAGGRLLQRLSQHQKTVTCVALSPLAGPDTAAAPRMLSGSLDGHVKVRDLCWPLVPGWVNKSIGGSPVVLALVCPIFLQSSLAGKVVQKRLQQQRLSKMSICGNTLDSHCCCRPVFAPLRANGDCRKVGPSRQASQIASNQPVTNQCDHKCNKEAVLKPTPRSGLKATRTVIGAVATVPICG